MRHGYRTWSQRSKAERCAEQTLVSALCDHVQELLIATCEVLSLGPITLCRMRRTLLLSGRELMATTESKDTEAMC